MIDRRTIRVFMSGMLCMGLMLMGTLMGTVWYQRTFRDSALDAAFEAEMRAHEAFLAEHSRRMEELARPREIITTPPREEKSPCP